LAVVERFVAAVRPAVLRGLAAVVRGLAVAVRGLAAVVVRVLPVLSAM
jgi:hypothetical protein